MKEFEVKDEADEGKEIQEQEENIGRCCYVLIWYF